MDKNTKRQHNPEFKIKVVLDLLKQDETINQICSKYNIHPTQARRWKEHVLAEITNSFNGSSIVNQLADKDKLIEELYRQVGQLKVELDWLKKKLGYSTPNQIKFS